MLYAILLILLGAVAASSLIVAKRPDAEKYLKMLVPYQGIAGVVFFVWGIFGLISALTSLSMLGWGMWGIIFWATMLATAVLETSLGFILGYSLIAKFAAGKNEAAAKKGAELLAKLTPLQCKLGVAAICLGVWYILAIVFGLFTVTIS